MMIYVNPVDFKCYTTNDGNCVERESAFFDGKCKTFIEGYCYDDSGDGVHIYPWMPLSALDDAQREYEKEKLADAENALAILLGGEGT